MPIWSRSLWSIIKEQYKYYYEYGWDSTYCYPNSHVLKNKLNIRNQAELEAAESAITSVKSTQLMMNRLNGRFGTAHLKKIHKFLFCDIYSWAGKIRTVNIFKGNPFCRAEYIESQLNMLFMQLKEEKYLKDYSGKEEFGKRLAYYLSEINVIHPFREGNGRTQRMFIEHLAYNAGYTLDFMKINSDDMLEASVQAYGRNYDLMEQIIIGALTENICSEY